MRRRTMRFRLFVTYAIMILLVSAIYAVGFYIYESREFTTRSLASIEELSLGLSNKLDLEIQKMDNVTLSVAYSSLIKDILLRIANRHGDGSTYTMEQISEIKALNEIMVAAIGPTQAVRELTIYDLEGNRISSGALVKYGKDDVTKRPWFDTVIGKGGGSFIGPPEKDAELAKSFVFFKDKFFISLFRAYYGDYGKLQGIIQAQQDADIMFSSLIALEKESGSDKRYYVFNAEGDLFYPYDGDSGEGAYYYNQFMRTGKSSLYVDRYAGPGKELVSFHVSGQTGWILAVAASRQELIDSLNQFTLRLALATVAVLLLALIYSYYAARRITKPIARLHSAIKKMDINEGVRRNQPVNSGIYEIEELQLAFNRMNAKLQHSVEKLLFAQTQEIRATMAALSSQMNPHFLFNTITTISVMAEENMSREITLLCQKLSRMLRYISSEESGEVSLGAEIEYTAAYLECMKIRYPDDLHYTIEIDDELLQIPVPKLIVQPLVENCIKHGIHVQSPWFIRIAGKVTDDRWTITVSDNGPGMPKDKRQALLDKIEELNETNKFPGLNVEGMGLLNIYFRLKLTYGDRMIFEIGEPPHGFVITIGGPIVR